MYHLIFFSPIINKSIRSFLVSKITGPSETNLHSNVTIFFLEIDFYRQKAAENLQVFGKLYLANYIYVYLSSFYILLNLKLIKNVIFTCEKIRNSVNYIYD